MGVGIQGDDLDQRDLPTVHIKRSVGDLRRRADRTIVQRLGLCEITTKPEFPIRIGSRSTHAKSSTDIVAIAPLSLINVIVHLTADILLIPVVDHQIGS